MPGVRAELVEGVVFMSSPVRATEHGEPHSDLIVWFGIYRLHTLGVRAADNSTLRLDHENEPQPDVIAFIDPACGGKARIESGYLAGSPELIAEVSASTASIDRNAKYEVYQRNQIQEYIIWRVYDEAIDWFVFQDGAYVSLAPDPTDSLYKSRVFPGLWLDAAALIRGDLPAVAAALNRGLATPEHAAFVAQLAARRPTP
jgi:Uma2 family endonuclease